MTLRDLNPGDFFFPASQIKKRQVDVFQVLGDKCEFNRFAGTATRKCMDAEGKVVDKQCSLELMPMEKPPDAPKPEQPKLF